MAQGFLAGCGAANIMGLPPARKFGTALPQPCKQFLERGIAGPQSCVARNCATMRRASSSHEAPNNFRVARLVSTVRRMLRSPSGRRLNAKISSAAARFGLTDAWC